jgi:hypothetical protein
MLQHLTEDYQTCARVASIVAEMAMPWLAAVEVSNLN